MVESKNNAKSSIQKPVLVATFNQNKMGLLINTFKDSNKLRKKWDSVFYQTAIGFKTFNIPRVYQSKNPLQLFEKRTLGHQKRF